MNLTKELLRKRLSQIENDDFQDINYFELQAVYESALNHVMAKEHAKRVASLWRQDPILSPNDVGKIAEFKSGASAVILMHFVDTDSFLIGGDKFNADGRCTDTAKTDYIVKIH